MAGCAHGPIGRPLPLDGRWRTLKAEQRIGVDVTRKDGGHDHRTLRAVIAVEKPDRFRLRALAPGGITLFDLVGVGDRVLVIESLRDPSASPAAAALLQSLAGDVQAAYDLGAPGRRRVEQQGDHLVVREPGRVVRVWPARIEVDNLAQKYRVAIDSLSQEIDVALDPALFADPAR